MKGGRLFLVRWGLMLPLALGLSGAVWSAPARAKAPHAAHLLKGPYLTGLSGSSVCVRLELDAQSPARLEVRRDGADAGVVASFEEGAAVMHVLHATGLDSASSYSYAVLVSGRVAFEGRFSTAPAPDSGAPLKFLVYGDNRSDPITHAAVVRALTGTPSDFLVNTGDMVEDGGRPEDWQSFFDVETSLLRSRPIFVSIGNHELYDDRAGANFARYFGFDESGTLEPYGTVRLSNVRFFFLNSMHDWASGDERQWLEQELTHADAEPGLLWRIGVMHQGPWSGGPHGGSPTLNRGRVPDLLRAHGVDLVLSGHDHIYERGESDGIKYVVSGGGGSPLYGVSKIATTRKAEAAYHYVEVSTSRDDIRLVARRVDGSILDQCGFRKGGSWECDPQPSGFNAAGLSPSHSTQAPARCGCTLPGAGGSGGAAALVVGIVLLAKAVRKRAPRGLDRFGSRPVRSS